MRGWMSAPGAKVPRGRPRGCDARYGAMGQGVAELRDGDLRNGLDCSELFEHDGEGPRHDLHVLPEGLVADVFEVKTQLATDIVDALIVTMIHLRPPCDAGAHALALAVAVDLLAQPREDRRLLGARSHDVHFPPQHVDQLRQLVEAIEAQDA